MKKIITFTILLFFVLLLVPISADTTGLYDVTGSMFYNTGGTFNSYYAPEVNVTYYLDSSNSIVY